MPGKPKIKSLSLEVTGSNNTGGSGKPKSQSSYHSFAEKYRLIGSDLRFSNISSIWSQLKESAKQNGISEDQVKKFQTQPPVNNKIKIFTPTDKNKMAIFAIVSVNKKGETFVDTKYKPPSQRSAATGPSAQLASILRKNASVSVSDFNSIWKQVTSNLEPGVSPKDIVIRESGNEIQIYAPGKKGVLKKIESLKIKTK